MTGERLSERILTYRRMSYANWQIMGVWLSYAQHRIWNASAI